MSNFFLLECILGTHKKGSTEFASLWMKKNLNTPRKKCKKGKTSLYKGSKKYVLQFIKNFATTIFLVLFSASVLRSLFNFG